MKKWRKQWCFEVVVLKQVALMLGNVECLKKTSSHLLETPKSRFHHCCDLKKTGQEDTVTARV
jgi:hypothetical protein